MLLRKFSYECPQQVEHLILDRMISNPWICLECIGDPLYFFGFRELGADELVPLAPASRQRSPTASPGQTANMIIKAASATRIQALCGWPWPSLGIRHRDELFSRREDLVVDRPRWSWSAWLMPPPCARPGESLLAAIRRDYTGRLAAHDLVPTPSTGASPVLVGDAHSSAATARRRRGRLTPHRRITARSAGGAARRRGFPWHGGG